MIDKSAVSNPDDLEFKDFVQIDLSTPVHESRSEISDLIKDKNCRKHNSEILEKIRKKHSRYMCINGYAFTAILAFTMLFIFALGINVLFRSA